MVSVTGAVHGVVEFISMWVTPSARGRRVGAIENATDDTWRNVRRELDRMHLITLATADGHVAQRTATTAGQKTLLAALLLAEPVRFFDFTIPTG